MSVCIGFLSVLMCNAEVLTQTYVAVKYNIQIAYRTEKLHPKGKCSKQNNKTTNDHLQHKPKSRAAPLKFENVSLSQQRVWAAFMPHLFYDQPNKSPEPDRTTFTAFMSLYLSDVGGRETREGASRNRAKRERDRRRNNRWWVGRGRKTTVWVREKERGRIWEERVEWRGAGGVWHRVPRVLIITVWIITSVQHVHTHTHTHLWMFPWSLSSPAIEHETPEAFSPSHHPPLLFYPHFLSSCPLLKKNSSVMLIFKLRYFHVWCRIYKILNIPPWSGFWCLFLLEIKEFD